MNHQSTQGTQPQQQHRQKQGLDFYFIKVIQLQVILLVILLSIIRMDRFIHLADQQASISREEVLKINETKFLSFMQKIPIWNYFNILRRNTLPLPDMKSLI